MAYPPWHLWGVTQNLALSTDPTAPPTASGQLARIGAKFPTTWSFFFWVKVLANPNAQGSSIQVSWDLIMGVGRSNAQIPAFVNLSPWTAGAAATTTGALAWTSNVQGLGQFVPGVAAITPVLLNTDRIIAESIQCNARAALLGGTAGNAPVEIEVGAQFAPITHVRPDWFIEHFSGEELGGQ